MFALRPTVIWFFAQRFQQIVHCIDLESPNTPNCWRETRLNELVPYQCISGSIHSNRKEVYFEYDIIFCEAFPLWSIRDFGDMF